MAQQIKIGDLLPARFVEKTRNFVDGEYLQRRETDMLPPIRNRHEAYGFLAEAAVQLAGAAKAVSKAMDMAMGALSSAQDGSFIEATQTIFTSALDSAVFAASVAVCATNVTSQLMSCGGDRAPTPLESASAIPQAPDVGDEYLPEGTPGDGAEDAAGGVGDET